MIIEEKLRKIRILPIVFLYTSITLGFLWLILGLGAGGSGIADTKPTILSHIRWISRISFYLFVFFTVYYYTLKNPMLRWILWPLFTLYLTYLYVKIPLDLALDGYLG